MQLASDSHTAFNARAAVEKSRLLPVTTAINNNPLTCINCNFINPVHYNYCTNCGYPVHSDINGIELFNQRVLRRKLLQQKCFAKIAYARNALYLLAGFSLLGIFYLFSNWKGHVIKGLVMIFLAIMYAGLGRWSLRKPFTALLISLMMLITFAAINTWAEFTAKSSSASAPWLLIIQLILIYFLLQGVKGAFQADILEEEFKL
jgi:hypothetical protein